MNIVLTHGAVLGALPGITERTSSMPEVYAALLKARVISNRRLNELTRLNRARNALQHRYGIYAEASEIYAAALLASQLVKSFGKDFSAWLAKTGIIEPPRS